MVYRLLTGIIIFRLPVRRGVYRVKAGPGGCAIDGTTREGLPATQRLMAMTEAVHVGKAVAKKILAGNDRAFRALFDELFRVCIALQSANITALLE